jgi:hypothetical protein
LLFASAGGLALTAVIVNASPPWPDIGANIAGWRDLVAAARASGMRNLPDPIASSGPPLVRPLDGDVDATQPNRSEGARLIVETSLTVSKPNRPVVVVTGGRLTDVADAYLLDHGLPDRIVVMSSLGATSASGGAMGVPNGEMDPWADTIVVQRLRYVQVSAYYDQKTDVPAARLSDLPANPFGSWITAKQPGILDLVEAADQVSVISLALPAFVVEVDRVSQSSARPFDPGGWPLLETDPAGRAWLVTRSASPLASARFWQLLLDARTYGR